MWVDLNLPEVEAFAFWNPSKGLADIGDDELNRAGPEGP
jgi:hypothetical protein